MDELYERVNRQLNRVIGLFMLAAVVILLLLWAIKPTPQTVAAGWVHEIIGNQREILARQARAESLIVDLKKEKP